MGATLKPSPRRPQAPAGPPRSGIGRHPLAICVLLATGGLAGFAAGAVTMSKQDELDRRTAEVAGLRISVATAAADLEDSREEARDLAASRDAFDAEVQRLDARVERLDARLKRLLAKAEVPAFAGETPKDARTADVVKRLRWRVRTSTRVSTEKPGTVIEQTPAAGQTLQRGKTLELVLAKPAPPKPPEWVTIRTLRGDASTNSGAFTIPEGATARLEYRLPDQGRNEIRMYRAPRVLVDRVLEATGPQTGVTRIYRSGTFHLDVTGAYTIRVQVYKRPE
jgi:hypothetical protein